MYGLLVAQFIKKLKGKEFLQNQRIPGSNGLLRSHAAQNVAKHTKHALMHRHDGALATLAQKRKNTLTRVVNINWLKGFCMQLHKSAGQKHLGRTHTHTQYSCPRLLQQRIRFVSISLFTCQYFPFLITTYLSQQKHQSVITVHVFGVLITSVHWINYPMWINYLLCLYACWCVSVWSIARHWTACMFICSVPMVSFFFFMTIYV